jgi:hypothetical protein
MAIPTGTGTEVLKSVMFEDLDALNSPLIIGIKFHTYTVLSVISHCISVDSATDVGIIQLRGFDAHGGTTDSVILIATYNIVANESFVWNDKFVFFGGEPANQAVISDAATMLAIGVQNSSVVQSLEHTATDTAAIYDVTVSYIEQDWS